MARNAVPKKCRRPAARLLAAQLRATRSDSTPTGGSQRSAGPRVSFGGGGRIVRLSDGGKIEEGRSGRLVHDVFTRRQVEKGVCFGCLLQWEICRTRWRKRIGISTHPSLIREDRDILLARMKSEHFTLPYKYYSHNRDAAPFRIPKQFLNDEEVVAAAVRRYPEVLMQDDALPAPELFDSKKVFLSFVQSERMEKEGTPLTTPIRAVASTDASASRILFACFRLDSGPTPSFC